MLFKYIILNFVNVFNKELFNNVVYFFQNYFEMYIETIYEKKKLE